MAETMRWRGEKGWLEEGGEGRVAPLCGDSIRTSAVGWLPHWPYRKWLGHQTGRARNPARVLSTEV